MAKLQLATERSRQSIGKKSSLICKIFPGRQRPEDYKSKGRIV